MLANASRRSRSLQVRASVSITNVSAGIPTDLRPSRPAQQWVFRQAKELTTLPGLRYSSGHRKGRLKILSIIYHLLQRASEVEDRHRVRKL